MKLTWHWTLIGVLLLIGFAFLAMLPIFVAQVDWPAWIQAVGSILAIVFAALITLWQHEKEAENSNMQRKRELQDRKDEAERDTKEGTESATLERNSLVLLLLPEFEEIRQRALDVEKFFADHVNGAGHTMASPRLVGIPITTNLNRCWDRFSILQGSNAVLASNLHSLILSHDRLIKAEYGDDGSQHKGMAVSQLSQSEKRIRESGKLVFDVVEALCIDLSPVYDKIVADFPRQTTYRRA